MNRLNSTRVLIVLMGMLCIVAGPIEAIWAIVALCSAYVGVKSLTGRPKNTVQSSEDGPGEQNSEGPALCPACGQPNASGGNF